MKTYKIRNKADGGILEVTEDQLAEFGLEVPKAEKGKMIKRKDGSYSRRGLWDNIRANKGSGKKPTKAMLKQEAKIRAAEKAYGGYMQKGGNVSIKQIEKDAKWKPSDKKYIPLPPAPIVDYPPSYIIDETLPPVPPQPFNYPIGRYNLPGTYVQTPEFAEGGKLPAELLRARLEAHMSPSEAQDYLKKYQTGGERFPENVRIHANNPNLFSDAYLQGVFETSINPKWDSATRAEASKDYDNMLKAREYVKYLDSLKMENRIKDIKKLKESPSMLDNIWGYTRDFLKFDEGGMMDEAGDGKWIQKATASIKRRGTEGVCTGSKFGSSSCPPGSKRYNLAKTFRKMAKSRKKEDGGYAQGGEYEMTDAQIAKLRAMGYKIKEV